MPTDRRRIVKELSECAKDEHLTGVSVKCAEEKNYVHLLGKIKGPSGTVYEGGVFNVDIVIPDAYPFEPPKMKFTTKIWHPNVSSVTGAICLDILKDQWSPALTIKTALVSLQALLSAPEPKDPQDAEVAKMYLEHPKEFENTAKYWTEQYAREVGSDEIIQGLMEMGFSEDQVKDALAETGGDQEKALNVLLGG